MNAQQIFPVLVCDSGLRRILSDVNLGTATARSQGCIQMQCRGVRWAGPGCGAQSAGILIVTASLSRIPEGEHTFYVNMK